MHQPEHDLSVREAILARRSIRAFLPEPVPQSTLKDILASASRAPSGANTQPWQVYVVQGAARQELTDAVCEAHEAIQQDPALASAYQEEFSYYPQQWISPFIDRRRENGWGLYGLLGIEKTDREAMHRQHQRNFRLFDAPVGLFFTVHRTLERGSLLDYGMFLQNVMLAASAHGLATCPQAAWNRFARLILPRLGAAEHEVLVCGMALGYADPQALVNRFETPRAPVEQFTRWIG